MSSVGHTLSHRLQIITGRSARGLLNGTDTFSLRQPYIGKTTDWSGLNQDQLNVIRFAASQYLVATISDEQQPVTTANGSEY